MEGLSVFLKENAGAVENIRYVVSHRFRDGKGNPAPWEFRCITSAEDEELKRACTKRVPIAGRKNAYMPETDYNKYVGMLAAKCTVFPNLNDKTLQDSYGVMGADALLKAMLTPGEYNNLLSKVQEINGFDIPVEDLVDEAKN